MNIDYEPQINEPLIMMYQTDGGYVLKPKYLIDVDP